MIIFTVGRELEVQRAAYALLGLLGGFALASFSGHEALLSPGVSRPLPSCEVPQAAIFRACVPNTV